MSSTFAARPVATSMTSALISSVAPPSGPTSTQTPSLVTSTLAGSKRAFVMTLMPRRVKLFSTSCAHLAVLERHDRREVLEQGHRGADVVEEAGELDADGAAADDDDALRAHPRGEGCRRW